MVLAKTKNSGFLFAGLGNSHGISNPFFNLQPIDWNPFEKKLLNIYGEVQPD